MPLRFVRDDITKMKTDAIVLPANNELKMGPGASESIFKSVGQKQMEKELNLLHPDGCEMGKAVVTPGHDRPAKHVMLDYWNLEDEKFVIRKKRK